MKEYEGQLDQGDVELRQPKQDLNRGQPAQFGSGTGLAQAAVFLIGDRRLSWPAVRHDMIWHGMGSDSSSGSAGRIFTDRSTRRLRSLKCFFFLRGDT